MTSDRRQHVRTWRVLVAVPAGILLVPVRAVGPARAAESQWVDFGGNARAYSAVYSVSVGGLDYDVTRGLDNNIWFRYSRGPWQLLGGHAAARTTSPPRIVEFPPGRAMTLIRGTDQEIGYSQANNGGTNSWTPWTPWTRLPAGANAIGSTAQAAAAGDRREPTNGPCTHNGCQPSLG
ncbi:MULTISPECIES: hypothetical protein [unclassified Streptomyces]|uniref:hypothetical protein n=1 Tax=unclassified Streptomyces TaxID=2593676 RepID=UPI003803FD8D